MDFASHVKHMWEKDLGHLFKSWNFQKKMDMFPNVLLAYKILSTILVTVASADQVLKVEVID